MSKKYTRVQDLKQTKTRQTKCKHIHKKNYIYIYENIYLIIFIRYFITFSFF